MYKWAVSIVCRLCLVDTDNQLSVAAPFRIIWLYFVPLRDMKECVRKLLNKAQNSFHLREASGCGPLLTLGKCMCVCLLIHDTHLWLWWLLVCVYIMCVIISFITWSDITESSCLLTSSLCAESLLLTLLMWSHTWMNEDPVKHTHTHILC